MTSKSLVEAALSQVGFVPKDYRDTGYGAWYGLNNNPYSAIFVSWCFKKIGRSDLIQITSDKGFASPQIGFDWFHARDMVLDPERAKPGDLVFFSTTGATIDHVGIVSDVYKYGILSHTFALETVEADMCGEFDSVHGIHKRVRVLKNNKSIVGVARIKWDLVKESTL